MKKCIFTSLGELIDGILLWEPEKRLPLKKCYELAKKILDDVQIVIKDILSENNFKINNIYDFKSNKIKSLSNKTIESKLQQLSKKISKNKK